MSNRFLQLSSHKRIAAAVVVLVALLIYALSGGGSRKPEEKLSVSEVTRGSLIQTVGATGRIVSNLDVEIKSKASGAIVKLPFDVSMPVKKGDLVVELDPVDEDRRVKEAEATLFQAEAKLRQAEFTLAQSKRELGSTQSKARAQVRAADMKLADARARASRRKELASASLGSQEELDAARTSAVQAASDATTAQAELENASAQELALRVKEGEVEIARSQRDLSGLALAEARQRLSETKVYSPVDGTVSARTVQIGQIVASGITNVGGGTAILTVSDLSQIFVIASVDESDIGRVEIGQAVRLRVDAYPGQIFDGVVRRIATRGVNVNQVITFEVKIEVVDKKKGLLKPEMTANTEIVLEKRDDVLLVPVGAVSRKGDETIVEVVGGRTVERKIGIGMTDGASYEVTEGLTAGERVAVRDDQAKSKWRADRQMRPPGLPPILGGRR